MTILYTENFTGVTYHALDHNGNPIQEIMTVNGWVPFWREDAGATILRPEMLVIDAVPPYLNPPRTNGVRGLKVFKLYSRNDAGYWRQFSIPAGVTKLRVTGSGHHWYSQRDDAYKSEYQDEHGVWHTLADGDNGATVRVGVDAQGGIDPWAQSVVWVGHTIYDQFGDVVVEVATPGPIVTAFLRSEQLYPFKHTDAYWASVVIEAEGAEPCRGLPREQYARVYNVIPQDATLDAATAIFQSCWQNGKQTVGGSSDDAGIGALDNRTAVEWNRTDAEKQDYLNFYNTHYPGVKVLFKSSGSPPDPPDPPIPPDPDWTPHNYVPKGTKLGFHCIGSYPFDLVNQIAAGGARLSSVKFVQAIGDLPRAVEAWRLARFIDRNGQNLEWFNYDGDPVAQAEARMTQVLAGFSPYGGDVDWIEIINEQAPPTPAYHVKLAQFFIRAMDIADDYGLNLALFSHSVGVPEPSAWDAIADTGVFEHAAAGGHAISLHEYGDASGGPSSVICRYRDLYNRIILPRHLDIPLFITEYNVENTQLGGDVFGQWVAYDNLLRQDPYVAGAHIFTLGSGMGWDNYVNATVTQFAKFRDYAIAQKDVANG